MAIDECRLEMTSDELADIRQCESVIVREYERADGSRFAKAVAWGDADEMEMQAVSNGMFIVPVGFKIVAQRAIAVSELLPPVADKKDREHDGVARRPQ